MAMVVVKKSVIGCSFLFLVSLLVFVAVAGAAQNEDNSNPRDVEEDQFHGLNISSFAARAKESQALNENAVQDPEEVVSMVEMSMRNSTERRKLGYFSCGTGNPIDDCWRFKTIDARGVNVHIANGACLTIQFITNVIVHGLHIHDCKPTGNALVRSSPSHYGWRTMADGDAISIFGSSHIWIDHNSLSNCADGLVDAVLGSTAITISNNYFTHHNERLVYEGQANASDYRLQPFWRRCRHGYFHVVNNDYTHWEMYAIGGSASPTINSQGNRYLAPVNPFAKEVTKRVDTAASQWHGWNWRSEGDLLLNGAYFTPSGAGASASYARASSLGAKSSSMVGTITSGAGVLGCRRGRQC
ncbi:AmbAllergen [Cynara cardunculus var. scolymus]|uniref:Pectate lyase n=1 Tax=Cynara cardunculus var. scolymus TaxID=59895 RepID=A0A118K4W0_CYNCS|nr:AmbAllergen [Cynara cardunculus var. scolymus]